MNRAVTAQKGQARPPFLNRPSGRAGLLIFLWFALEFMDPLGLGAAAKRASALLFNALSGPVHGFSANPASDRIAVVEIGDGGPGSEARAAVWPIPLETHALWLLKILEESPRALFVDVRYQQRIEGEGLPQFHEVLEEARARDIPILFSAGGKDWAPLPEELRPLGSITAWPRQRERAYPLVLEEHGAVSSVPASRGSDHGTVPASSRSSPGGQVAHHGATDAHAPSGAGGEHGTATRVAAYDLYARLCAAKRMPEHCSGAPHDADFASPLEIRWNAYPDAWQSALNSGCRTRELWEPLDRLLRAAGYLLRSMVSLVREGIHSDCRPNLTLDVNEWHRQRADGTSLPQWSLLRDRVVFFGFGTVDSNDRVDAPLLGSVPGVQMHAQVFENLLSSGPRYARLAPERLHLTPEIGLNWSELAEGALWIGLVLVVWLFVWRQNRSVQDLTFPRRLTSGRITACVLLGTGALLVVDLVQRGETTAWFMLLVGYGILALSLRLFLWTWQPRQEGSGAPLLPQGDSWLRKVTAIPALGGLLLAGNELVLHWAGTDWVAFVILYFSLMAEMTHQHGGAGHSVAGASSITSTHGKAA